MLNIKWNISFSFPIDESTFNIELCLELKPGLGAVGQSKWEKWPHGMVVYTLHGVTAVAEVALAL